MTVRRRHLAAWLATLATAAAILIPACTNHFGELFADDGGASPDAPGALEGGTRDVDVGEAGG